MSPGVPPEGPGACPGQFMFGIWVVPSAARWNPCAQSSKLLVSVYTDTSSFDDWAQGFHLAADGTTQIPNMNCPGQAPGPSGGTPGDIFFYALANQPQYLDYYNAQHGGPAAKTIPY